MEVWPIFICGHKCVNSCTLILAEDFHLGSNPGGSAFWMGRCTQMHGCMLGCAESLRNKMLGLCVSRDASKQFSQQSTCMDFRLHYNYNYKVIIWGRRIALTFFYVYILFHCLGMLRIRIITNKCWCIALELSKDFTNIFPSNSERYNKAEVKWHFN